MSSPFPGMNPYFYQVAHPSNESPGDDREQYLRKRRRILRSSARLVEIDLLRGGQRMSVYDAPPSNYRVMVSRRPRRPDVQVWPVGYVNRSRPCRSRSARAGAVDARPEATPRRRS